MTLKSKAIDVESGLTGVQTLASTQTHAGKCESESQETKQAHVPFVIWLEHCHLYYLPHGGIYDVLS